VVLEGSSNTVVKPKIMEEIKPIIFLDYKCSIKIERYSNNNRIALDLNDAETGEPIARATLNDPETMLLSDEVIIKDYSENEGMLKCLVDAEIIAPPHSFTKNAYPICRLLIPRNINNPVKDLFETLADAIKTGNELNEMITLDKFSGA
jgi:hypothetical protein